MVVEPCAHVPPGPFAFEVVVDAFAHEARVGHSGVFAICFHEAIWTMAAFDHWVYRSRAWFDFRLRLPWLALSRAAEGSCDAMCCLFPDWRPPLFHLRLAGSFLRFEQFQSTLSMRRATVQLDIFVRFLRRKPAA